MAELFIIEEPELLQMLQENGDPFVVCFDTKFLVGQELLIAGQPFRIRKELSNDEMEQIWQEIYSNNPNYVKVPENWGNNYLLVTD